MTVIFSDDFSAALSGTNWSDEAGVWSTGSGVLACSTSNLRVLKTTTSAHASITDVKVSANRASATFDGCLIVRSTVAGATSNTGSCYFLNWFDTNTIQIFRRVTTTNSQIGTDITATHVNGSKVSLQVTGSGATVTLKAFVDDVEVGSRDDTSGSRITTGGQTGFFVFSNASRFDNFSVDDLAGAGGGQAPRSSAFLRMMSNASGY